MATGTPRATSADDADETEDTAKPWRLITDRRQRLEIIVPTQDLRPHDDTSDRCWCQPRVDVIEGRWRLVVHHSLDGRELVEQHGVN